MDRTEFLAWEMASQDVIDVKRIYIDIAGDLAAGLLLSQLIYWHLPSKQGGSKLRVRQQGHNWIAKTREDWWLECRLTPRQIDRASAILETRGLIVTGLFRFNASPTKHYRLNWPTLLTAISAWCRFTTEHPDYGKLHKPQNPFYTNRKMDFTQTARSITETTAETTAETTEKASAAAAAHEEGAADWLAESRIPENLRGLDLTKGMTPEEKAAVASPAAEVPPETGPEIERWRQVMIDAHPRYVYQYGYTREDVLRLVQRFAHLSGIAAPEQKPLSKKWHAGAVQVLYNAYTQLKIGDQPASHPIRFVLWSLDLFYSEYNPLDHVTASSPRSFITIIGNLIADLRKIQKYAHITPADLPLEVQIASYYAHKRRQRNGQPDRSDATVQGGGRADAEAKAEASRRRQQQPAEPVPL